MQRKSGCFRPEWRRTFGSEAKEVHMKRSDQGRALDARLKEAEKKIVDLLRKLEETQRKINKLPDATERAALSEQFNCLVDAFVGSNRAMHNGTETIAHDKLNASTDE
jgi:hypothetical protein